MFEWWCSQNRLPIEDNATNHGVMVEGRCPLCDDGKILEDQEHLFIHYDYTSAI